MPNNYFSEKIPIKYNMIELNQRIFGLYVTMLNDKLRNQFFYDALKKHVKGKVVLDVGSGTGLLAAYALEHGAKFVYAVEQIEQSAKVAQFALESCYDQSKFKVITGRFPNEQIIDMIPEQSIDVLVSELVGESLFDEGQYTVWKNCAKHKFFKDDAISIPDRLHCDVHVWNSHFDLVTGEVEDQARNPVQDVMLDEDALLLTKFSDALVDFDKNPTQADDYRPRPVTHNTGFMPSFKIHAELNAVDIKPDQTLKDIVSIDKDHLPDDVSFEIHLDEDKQVTVVIDNKISFTDKTLYLKDGAPPWKWSSFFKLSKAGTYKFTASLSTENPFSGEDVWKIKKIFTP